MTYVWLNKQQDCTLYTQRVLVDISYNKAPNGLQNCLPRWTKIDIFLCSLAGLFKVFKALPAGRWKSLTARRTHCAFPRETTYHCFAGQVSLFSIGGNFSGQGCHFVLHSFMPILPQGDSHA